MKDLQVDVIIIYSTMTMKNKHLPKNLRDYQVMKANTVILFRLFIKVDILAAVSSSVENRNILVALPTGSGHQVHTYSF